MHGVQHCKLLHRDDLAGRLIRHIRLRQCLHFSKNGDSTGEKIFRNAKIFSTRVSKIVKMETSPETHIT